MTCLWHEFMSYDAGVCELIWYYEVIYKMMLAPFTSDWNHHVKLLATILCWLCKNSFTISPITWPWEKLTGLVIGFKPRGVMKDEVYTLEKEHQNYYCTCCRVAHISFNRIDLQFANLFHGKTKCKRILQMQNVCLWLQEHSLSWP